MKMKFSINNNSKLFNRVGPGYRVLRKYTIIDQYVGFPGEGYNFSFTDEFHTVSNAPTLYRVNDDDDDNNVLTNCPRSLTSEEPRKKGENFVLEHTTQKFK
jgi:hypothetical protein